MKSCAKHNSRFSIDAASDFVWPKKVDVLGVQVSSVTYDEAVDVILSAASRELSAVVSCHAVHAIVTMSGDDRLKGMVNQFEMITPDGQPVRWAINWLHRCNLPDRVYGPELMLRLCQRAAESGTPIYLYGGNEHVARTLPDVLKNTIPELNIVGSESPPFRPLTPEEDRAVIQRINHSGAKLVFIGLGCPKQDQFAAEHRDSIQAIQICVGAAFDFHAGTKPMAPQWMQRCGLEWVFRLYQEPHRLWHRYLTTNTIFIWKLTRQLCGAKKNRLKAPDSGEPEL